MSPKTVRMGVSPIAWTNDDLPELGGHLDERGGAEVRLDLAGVPPGGLPLLAVAALLRPSDPTVKLEYRVEAVSGVLELRLLGAP